jgi:hypothetical protein
LAWGTPAALIFLKSSVFGLAPLAFCLFLGVWRGTRAGTHALQLIVLFGFYLGPTWLHAGLPYADVSLGRTAGVAALCVLLAFLLTRRALQHSSLPYRMPGLQ